MAHTSADATSLSPWWRHSVILVMIAGFSVLTLVTVLTYTNAPPIPERAVDATGTVVFTGTDILMGQEVFLKYGLMEHGTLWGHGAYLGPDYSAKYLHRLSEVTRPKDDRLQRLAQRIRSLAETDEHRLRRVHEVEAARRAAARELHSVCADLVAAVNGMLDGSEVLLDPPEYSAARSSDDSDR